MKDKVKIVKILQCQYNTLSKLKLNGRDLEVRLNKILDECDKHGIDYHEVTLGTEAFNRAKALGQI